MLSRVADNLYWFARYLQRAENTARLLNVHDQFTLDLPAEVTIGWSSLTEILGAGELFNSLYTEQDEASVVNFLLFDLRHIGSIRSSLSHARDLLRVSRDWVPREAWEQLNEMYILVEEHAPRGLPAGGRMAFLNSVVGSSLKLYGTLTGNMSRDIAFQFMRLGTNLEQADMTTRIVDVRAGHLLHAGGGDTEPYENLLWMGVLRSLAAYQMYRRHGRERVTGPGVAAFLLQDRRFPRSVQFCLGVMRVALREMPPSRAVERAIDRLSALVADASVRTPSARSLHQVLDEIQVGMTHIDAAIHDAWLKAPLEKAA